MPPSRLSLVSHEASPRLDPVANNNLSHVRVPPPLEDIPDKLAAERRVAHALLLVRLLAASRPVARYPGEMHHTLTSSSLRLRYHSLSPRKASGWRACTHQALTARSGMKRENELHHHVHARLGAAVRRHVALRLTRALGPPARRHTVDGQGHILGAGERRRAARDEVQLEVARLKQQRRRWRSRSECRPCRRSTTSSRRVAWSACRCAPAGRTVRLLHQSTFTLPSEDTRGYRKRGERTGVIGARTCSLRAQTPSRWRHRPMVGLDRRHAAPNRRELGGHILNVLLCLFQGPAAEENLVACVAAGESPAFVVTGQTPKAIYQ